MDKLVDFSQPIEAAHEDGAVIPVQARQAGTSHWDIFGHPSIVVCRRDGSTNTAWTIRNTANPSTPSTPSNEELTQRMEKAGEEAIGLLREMLGYDNSGYSWVLSRDLRDRAAAIVSDLPKPVDPIDPDLREAEQFAHGYADWRGNADEAVRMAYDCIKLGRTLAAGGTAHE